MNVLITGTSSGIGKGCAEYFLKNGHKVYGFDRNEPAIEHPDYIHYRLDIRDKQLYPELPPMQIVINNAGVQNEDDIQPTADETGMTADGFMNVSGSIPTGDISLKRSRPDTRRIREVPKSRAELKEKGSGRLR